MTVSSKNVVLSFVRIKILIGLQASCRIAINDFIIGAKNAKYLVAILQLPCSPNEILNIPFERASFQVHAVAGLALSSYRKVFKKL